MAAALPGAQLDMLVRKGNEGLLRNNPHLDETLVWEKKGGKYKDLMRLLRRIRRRKYDQIINLQRFGATGILTGFSGAKVRVGFEKNPFSFLFTKKILHEISAKDGPHETERNQQLIAHLTNAKAVRPKLYPGAEEMEAVTPYLHGGKFICIAPSSVWFTKQYPEEHWAEIISQVPKEMHIYLLGGADDHEICERLVTAGKAGQVKSLAGKLSLLASAALMTEASMNLVNDSAPLHLASAMNAPVAAIFCSTVPEFGFGPLSDDSHVFEVGYDLECRPCGIHGYRACPLGHFKCAHDIELQRIVELVNRL